MEILTIVLFTALLGLTAWRLCKGSSRHPDDK